MDDIYELNRIVELSVKYGREEVYKEILYDAMYDYLEAINANDEYIVEDCERDIPQFVCNL